MSYLILKLRLRSPQRHWNYDEHSFWESYYKFSKSKKLSAKKVIWQINSFVHRFFPTTIFKIQFEICNLEYFIHICSLFVEESDIKISLLLWYFLNASSFEHWFQFKIVPEYSQHFSSQRTLLEFIFIGQLYCSIKMLNKN